MLTLKKHFAIAAVYFRDATYFRSKLVTTLLLWIFRVAVLIILYKYTFNYLGKNVNNIGFEIAAWSIAIYFLFLNLDIRRITKQIMLEIISGNVEVKIAKPVHYLSYKYAEHFGRSFLGFVVILVVAIPLLVILVGLPQLELNFLWIVSSFTLFIGGAILALLVYGMIGMLAFWLENIDPITWIVDKSVMILGGSYIPVVLFPSAVRNLAEITPLGAINFITHIFNPDFPGKALSLITVQFFWIFICYFLLRLITVKADQKLAVNGG